MSRIIRPSELRTEEVYDVEIFTHATMMTTPVYKLALRYKTLDFWSIIINENYSDGDLFVRAGLLYRIININQASESIVWRGRNHITTIALIGDKVLFAYGESEHIESKLDIFQISDLRDIEESKRIVNGKIMTTYKGMTN